MSAPTLPKLEASLLVRTDFADRACQRPGIRRCHLAGGPKKQGPPNDHGASVRFVADGLALTSPDHPILVVDLTDTFLSVAEFAEIADRMPFRCIPSELCSVENNLNISNMDWEELPARSTERRVTRLHHVVNRTQAGGT